MSGVVDGIDDGVSGRLRSRLAVRALANVFWAAFCMGFGYEAKLVRPLTVMRDVSVSSAATLSLSNPIGDGKFPERMLGNDMVMSVAAEFSRPVTGLAARSQFCCNAEYCRRMDAVVGGEGGASSLRGSTDSKASGKGMKAPPDGDRMGCGYRRVLGRRVGGWVGTVILGL
jgi:hypothetical protein